MRRVRKLPADPAVPDGELDGDQDRLAVLIDADNAHAGIIDGLLAEIARYGVASVKRIYGDWTQPQLGSWKKVLLQHSIVPVQQFGYTKGKNATDSALIIDAMDLMYTRRFDGFCLVSSDSDFTRLASRLREEGLIVYGFGERKTPAPFVSACDRFVYTEVLRAQGARAGVPAENGDKRTAAETSATEGAVSQAQAAAGGKARSATSAGPVAGTLPASGATAGPPPGTPAGGAAKGTAPQTAANGSEAALPAEDTRALVEMIVNAIDAVSDDSGWAGLGAVGSTITKLRPDFDSRLYGHRKFSDLVRSMPDRFELEERATGAGKSIFVRLAPRPAPARKRSTRARKAPA